MTEPTYEDANLMIQINQWWAAADIHRDLNWVWSTKYILEYEKFVEKYPPGSKQFGRVRSVCWAMEAVGTLYKNGLFNEKLLFDWLAVDMYWNRIEGFALGLREAVGEPRIFENFEAMAKRGKELSG